MVKAYLRYELAATFGLVTSNSNAIYDSTGRQILSAALEDIAVWNIKQGALVKKLAAPSGDLGRAVAEVTQLAHSPVGPAAAAGHADGTVRLWNLVSGICDVTFSGHSAAVTALCYSKDGATLASGAQDTDVVVWDVAGETGLYRLRGHTDQVCDLVFLDDLNKLVSCSKDSHLRVWDLATQQCVQTVAGPRGEIWSLAVDNAGRRLAVGSAEPDLQLYEVRPASDDVDSDTQCLKYFGGVRRQASERVSGVRYDPTGRFLACHSAGKLVELFRVRSGAEAAKKAKRRKTRKKEKTTIPEEVADGGQQVVAADELGPWQVVRTKHKIRAVAWRPGAAPKGGLAQLALALADNSLEVWDLREEDASRSSVIDAGGHRSDTCLRTIESGYGLCAIFAPGSRHAVLGTKAGTLELLDVGASARLRQLVVHEGAVWSLAALPDSSGFVSGSADHDVKFWEWELLKSEDNQARQLSARHTRTLKMTDDVLCVRVSPNGKLLAVALLDSTIKVFFTDSLRFFLSLYGHKLPVLSMDISSDNTLLVSGSADKNIKIWGLDFGDCHKSLFAHADSVMQVAFVRNTHYVFTVGKDKVVKYWDADKWELLLTLEGHHAEVWCLAVSALGDFVITGSHDRSLRRWDQTQEAFFVEEEREKRLESLFEAGLAEPAQKAGVASAAEGQGVGLGSRSTSETLGAADRLVEALELAANEAARHQADDRQTDAAGQAAPALNPLLLGLDPAAYVLRVLAAVRPADLEQALMLLPFADALRLLGYLADWACVGVKLELLCRVTVLLMHIHHHQLVATAAARPVLITLQSRLRNHIKAFKDLIGFNLAALGHLQHMLQDHPNQTGGTTRLLPVKRPRHD
ncbi:hypothetical protein WJX72_012560 [[Myrmecia] bisecta]|uniref:Small-subunit processome Utp12 domain-containing protein n=1 Tax=[Myrmecia] bisecta TaxID=41462 RepID=A0AAW1PUW0_9CHLO